MTLRGFDSFSPHVRANHAWEPQAVAPGPTQAAPAAGRLPRPRPRTLAAGGAVLAHVWGLGLGMSAAYAADEPIVDTVRSVDAVVPLDRAITLRPEEAPAARPGTGSSAGSAGSTGGSGGSDGVVDQLLRNQIRAGGLPLPGQATAVPDAFSIAAVLLPAVPAQGRGQGEESGQGGQGGQPRASAAGSDGGSAELVGEAGGLVGRTGAGGVPAARSGGSTVAGAPAVGQVDGTAVRTAGTADAVSAAAIAARTAGLAASRDSGRTAVGALSSGGSGGLGTAADGGADGGGAQAAPGGGGAQAAARRGVSADPLAATGSENAVLIPIAAGLLLTGAAMYKHRGLPRGH